MLGLLSQPDVAGAGSLGELQLRIIPPLTPKWHGGDKLEEASYPLAGAAYSVSCDSN